MRKGLCFMMLVLWMYALIATIGLSLIIYLFECFPTATMIEIIYAIKSPSGSLSFSLYLPIILYFLLPCIIQVIIYITLSFSLKKTRLKKVSFFILSTISILVFGLYLEIKLDAIEYIQNYRKRSDFIENNYVDPQNVKLTFPEKKRNLIHIVLESMELSFADKVNGGVMNANRIPHLVQLAKEGETFAGELGNDILNGGIPVYGTGWTMGATFAMETGLPLKIGGNEMSSEKNFYNSIVTIGDTLYKNGYNNYVMLGSDSTFAGNDNFYRLHGDNTVIDYKYAAKKVSLELSTIALLSILALFVNGVADEDPDDYYAQLLALVFTRLPSERMTFYSPTLVSDLITSPTSAMSAFRRFLLIFDLAFDLAGLGEHQVDDVVSTGTYSGYRRWVKDICGILSGYGAHNIITNTNAKSLRWKNKFYKKILPVRIENLDGIMELFGIDLLKDKSTGGSGFGGGMSSEFSSGLGGGLSGGI